MIALSGDIDSGKTTLCRAICPYKIEILGYSSARKLHPDIDFSEFIDPDAEIIPITRTSADGILVLMFAAPIKEIVSAITGIKLEIVFGLEDKAYRELHVRSTLIQIANHARKKDDAYWAKHLVARVQDYPIIIEDLRFPIEYQTLRRHFRFSIYHVCSEFTEPPFPSSFLVHPKSTDLSRLATRMCEQLKDMYAVRLVDDSPAEQFRNQSRKLNSLDHP